VRRILTAVNCRQIGGLTTANQAPLVGEQVLLERLRPAELIKFAHDGKDARDRVVRSFLSRPSWADSSHDEYVCGSLALWVMARSRV
jgi:hypothetical protein